jgi:hypothetical protein
MKTKLPTVTLLGIDCVDIDRLVQVSEICQKDFEFAEVKLLTSLDAETHKDIVHIDPINTTEEYSKFIISKLNNYVDTEHVLIIQYDGFILNSEAWKDEYLKYDYIGAPWLVADWSVRDFGFPESTLGTLIVGNGGFSLRSKKLLRLLSKMSVENEIEIYHPEDVAICVKLRDKIESQGIKFAPIDIAKQFSFESVDDENDKWTNQFGFHGLRWTDISEWIKKHPEYKVDNALNRDLRD